jgi:RNA polymerase sigma-70 factor (sigma-E family)
VELGIEQARFPRRADTPTSPQDGAQRQADPLAGATAASLDDRADPGAEQAISDLYAAHAIGLIRLAVVMLGNRQAAEDVVQEAFCGLYRRWSQLAEPERALFYLRASVLNGCRSELRTRLRNSRRIVRALPGSVASTEDLVLIADEHREVLAAMRRLPDRQREALVLRFYADLGEEQIARSMGITEGTVKSTTSRALAALARMLGESR